MTEPHQKLSPDALADYAGKWVACDRACTQILSSGRTFSEAKQRAAAAGAHSVLIGKVSAARALSLGPHLIHVAAVFISQMI